MCAEALTQDEIDALLRGEPPPEKPSLITPEEEDTIKKYSSLVMDCGNDVLSTLLGESAVMEMVEYKETDPDALSGDLEGDLVVAEVNYKGLVQGKTAIIVTVDTALKLATQMTGGGAESDFGDLEESAFSEAIQSLYSSVNTQMAQQMGGEISLEPPDVTTKPPNLGDLLPESAERLILVKYELQSGTARGPIYQIIPRNLLNSLTSGFSGKVQTAMPSGDITREFATSSKVPPVMSTPAQFAPMGGASMGFDAMAGMGMPAMPEVDTTNLGLILDIAVEVKVELGRTHRKIREVLELGPGSVVELDQLAGEPIDILVNDKLFAKGEVVVIDENFGVRITDILSIEERIEALK
ncbi:MAG: flagellar motor switch protein FliN [Candidatus Omnitrophota bacterium]